MLRQRTAEGVSSCRGRGRSTGCVGTHGMKGEREPGHAKTQGESIPDLGASAVEEGWDRVGGSS